MAKSAKAANNVSKELAQALNLFVDHMHLSAEALEALIDKLEGNDPEDNRRSEDTLMEFGFLPASNDAGGGGGDDTALYLEGSQMFLESSTTPITLEQP